MEYILSIEGGPGRSHPYNLVQILYPILIPMPEIGPGLFVSSHCHAEIQQSDKWQNHQRKDASLRLCPEEGH